MVIFDGSPPEQILSAKEFKFPPVKAGATVTVTTLLSSKQTLLLRVEIALLLYVVLTVNAGGSYDAVVTLGLSSDQSDAPEGNAYHE